jgi:DNA repair exonuclease SbcCD ATPase subunit
LGKQKEDAKKWKEQVASARTELQEQVASAHTELQEQVASAHTELQQAVGEQERLHKELGRINVLMMARLSDYAKELDFWRDTIRKILYQGKGETLTAEGVVRQVTQTLKTYSTLSESFAWDAAKVMAGILRDAEV